VKTPNVLIVLDGFGLSDEVEGNAIKAAQTPAFDKIFGRYPHTAIDAHGTAVGLMPGLMGNSEVGHLNIGAGRVVAQDIDRINLAIHDGSFFENEALLSAVRAARIGGGRLHLFGLVSDGGVHSSDAHYRALLDLCAREDLRGDRVVMHAFLDGRDTPPRSADRYLADAQAAMAKCGAGVIGTIIGRYYAMDRDKRWERLQLAYDALVHGAGAGCDSAREGLASAYSAGENDEFVKPRIVRGAPRVARGDAVIFFNYRSDRARQLTEAFILPDFEGFPVTRDLGLTFVTMTQYKKGYPVRCAFEAISLEMVFGQLAEVQGLTQLRVAETEKYAHVTFFFNGGVEQPFRGEDRILVPSAKVATYDLQPEMSAPAITENVLKAIADGAHDAIIINYANADMVGHSGIFAAAVQAVEAVDRAVGAITDAVVSRSGTVLLTADHGNVEQMLDKTTGQPHTAHTINPVPLAVIGERFRGRRMLSGGRLCDVIPTFLEILGVDKPRVMTGHSLID
jgi:2,3-bisphosphoglycerate-independent phosphoglycerate mutase